MSTASLNHQSSPNNPFVAAFATVQRTLLAHCWTITTTVLLFLFSDVAMAQQVTMQLSAREAFVGSPLVLQIQIVNPDTYAFPDEFMIDGCDVRDMGPPSQSIRSTIYGNRRIESRSFTKRYAITPRREGEFRVPRLRVTIDGENRTSEAIPFIATKSETGDLLFAEIAGAKDKVYVGEPLELRLKIWIKPFVDRQNNVKLNEGTMWKQVSNQSTWGSFAESLQTLAANGQRPRGKSVLRDNGQGSEREYFLYEIESTVYPTKTGQIEAGDPQIIVDYPLALTRRRDPFGRIIDDRDFGGNSLLRQLLDDDSFPSPFRSGIGVANIRPVVANAKSGPTQVVPIPTNGQPDDYRGAVGRYKILTDTEATEVAAGDPISLRIGIVGNGPMELVQAPPLHEIPELIADFQVSDRALAGFVQEDTKLFVTKIRPKNESVKQIPPIPFSFFDPATESFETVYSEPIEITVSPAESLRLDSIVSNRSPTSNQARERESGSPDFSVKLSGELLHPETPPSRTWWIYFAWIPPVIWGAIIALRMAFGLSSVLAALRPARATALRKIYHAPTADQCVEAICEFVQSRTRSQCPTPQHAIGQIRDLGAYDVANQLETMLGSLVTTSPAMMVEHSSASPLGFRQKCDDMIMLLDKTIKQNGRRQAAKRSSARNKRRRLATHVALGLITATWCSTSVADQLSIDAQNTVLEQARSLVERAESMQGNDPEAASNLYAKAAERLEVLVESGVRNSQLFLNAGNAWRLSGDRVKAIVNYRRALWVDPSQQQAQENLQEVITKDGSRLDGDSESNSELPSAIDSVSIRNWSHSINRLIGHQNLQIGFAIASVLFWVLVCIKSVRRSAPVLLVSVAPALVMAACAACLTVASFPNKSAVVLVDQLNLRSADGDEFEAVFTAQDSAGKTIHVLEQRDDWLRVRFESDETSGWVPNRDVALIQLTAAESRE